MTSGLDFQMSESAESKVQSLVRFVKRFEAITEAEKSFCMHHLARAMVVKYVYYVNVGELVGVQTEEETREIIDRLWSQKSSDEIAPLSTCKEQLETQNSYLGLKHMDNLRNEMESTGLLTVQVICDAHKTLMKGLIRKENCGVIRKSEVYTHWDGGIHYYPAADIVESLFWGVIDRHNLFIHSLVDMNTEEKVPYTFKCAAWLHFTFVDIHPFVDGNGRLSRLLANYVLSHIMPFPVSANSLSGKEDSVRQQYIEAIVECRNSCNRHPIRLCEMLIDSALESWTNVFYNLEKMRWVVPIDIRQGSGKTKERVLHRNVDLQMVDISPVEEAIKEANMTNLEPHKCVAMSQLGKGN